MGEQLAAYDGTLHLYAPDDLYLIGDRAVLLALARACHEAAARGQALAEGYASPDGEGRAVVVVRLDALDSARSPFLPQAEPVRTYPHGIPPRIERPQPVRAPALVGVLAEYG